MIRSSSSFFISFTIHAIIAMLAFAAYQKISSCLPGVPEEKRLCISLNQYVFPPKTEPVPKKVTPLPPPKKIIKQVPLKPKIEPEVIVKAKPALKPKALKQVAVADPEVIKAAPVVMEIVEEIPLSSEPAVITAMPEPVAYAPVVQNVPQITPEEEYMQAHLALIAKLLQENLYYPRIARKRGITGEVIVAFELLKNGEATAIKVNTGARSILNRAAITTIERLSGEFPKPDEPITLHVPIRYQLQ